MNSMALLLLERFERWRASSVLDNDWPVAIYLWGVGVAIIYFEV